MRVAPWLHFFEAENEGNNWGLNQSAESTNKIYVFYVVIPEVRLVQHRLQLHWFGSSFAIVADAWHIPKPKISSWASTARFKLLITRLFFCLWYPGHLWICSPSIPPFYIDWRWRCWRPRKIERELDRGSSGPKKIQSSASTTSVHGDWPTTTGPWKRLTPGPLWYAIGEGCQESAEEAKDCAKESLGRWLVDFCRSFFNGPNWPFPPVACCSTLWV